jgi:hypothetical protein
MSYITLDNFFLRSFIYNDRPVAGTNHRFGAKLQFWEARAVDAAQSADPALPPPKRFIPKHDLPEIDPEK